MAITPERFLAYTEQQMPYFKKIAALARTQRNWWMSQKRQWPDWCFVPDDEMAWQLEGYLYNIHTEEAHERFTKRIKDTFGTEGKEFLRTALWIQSMAAWDITKNIYRFDPDLYRKTVETRVGTKLPVDTFFFMPEWTVFIETPYLVHDGHSQDTSSYYNATGFFAHLSWQESNKMSALNIIFPDTLPTPATIPLDHALSLRQSVIKRYTDEEDPDEFIAIMEPFIALTLQLCTIHINVEKTQKANARQETTSAEKNEVHTSPFPQIRKVHANCITTETPVRSVP